ncbi:hypothetical protein [Hyphomicrobium sp. LHD-15]|uniref:hypothetical protein n=1 Tax=Hyphomicrobium sp. LHD-15 TaxID=3072142 RepID=UPI00280CA164|nr:hypothetical protein [Hyphomicrobium sp. LHD-15]MDQ8699056.1 hypothetical protein [Hyphomicrobium sp. LHD-15]
MVWPTRVRRRADKHAFEQALDEARLDPHGEPILFDDSSSASSATGPAIGSLGDITTASGYVARESLVRAYDLEGDPGEQEAEQEEEVTAVPVERPSEAARKLKETLVGKEHAPGDLRRLRRRFASQNHPDRVTPEWRAEAVSAMAEINAEIDRALKRAKPA